MRLNSVSLVALISLTITGASVAAAPIRPGQKCDFNARGPTLDLQQRLAIKDYTRLLLLEGQAKKAFDAYVPGEFIQHSANGQSGREVAIAFLSEFVKIPTLTFTNISEWAGEGYGVNHYRVRAPAIGLDSIMFDRFRFKGTCFVEHWDVIQPVIGNETNPIAFF